jgi:hypothetical protein
MRKTICQLDNLPPKISTIGARETIALALTQISQIVAQTLNHLTNHLVYSKIVLTNCKINPEVKERK